MMRITAFLTLFFTLSTVFSYEITDLSKIKGHELEITSIHLNNKGYSTFPLEILTCANLVELNLADNGIINLPAGLGKLTRLKKLNLSGNEGVSYIDLDALFLSALFQLESLNLSDCDLGFISHQIGRQKGLKELNVAGNGLNNLPYPVIQLTKLEKVNVSNNQIEDLSWQVHQWWYLRELDVSGNKDLKMDDLMLSLTAKDSLKKLVMSHLNGMPRSFQDLAVSDLVIKSSLIRDFPRIETSPVIDRISFIDCKFERTEGIVSSLNSSAKPRYLCLNGMSTQDLQGFLNVRVDSANLQNNNLSTIKILAANKNLKWIDVRGNAIDQASQDLFSSTRADVTLLLSEPVQEMRGIVPPIEKFVPQPIVKTISANQENRIAVGRSVFTIPANAIVDSKGKTVEGLVDLSYTEYSSTTDIFLSGITMTADSANENLMFSSGGMFSLTAADKDGQELALRPNSTIQVNMLSTSNSTNMNLYQLNENGVWENKGKDKVDEPFKVDMGRVDSMANLAFQNYKRKDVIVKENRYVPYYKRDGCTRSFVFTFKELITDKGSKVLDEQLTGFYVKQSHIASSLIADQSYVYDGDMDSMIYYMDALKRMQRKSMHDYRKLRRGGRIFNRKNDYEWGVNYISRLNVDLDTETDRLLLSFLYKDSLVKIPVVLQSDPKNANGRVKVFQQFYKQLNAATKKDNAVKRNRNRKLMSLLRKEEKELVELARIREIARQQLYYDNRAYFDEIAGESSVSRGFSLSGFGVWNCDQRQRMIDPVAMPTEFVGENGQRIPEAADRQVYVIDYDMNGVLIFNNAKNAFYDRSSRRTAILVFLSSMTIGLYQSWYAFKNGQRLNQDQVPLRSLDLNEMSLNTFMELMER